MQNDWLTASSFERTHEILSAINTLSIHAKLALVGAEDSVDAGRLRESRGKLIEFLDQFSPVLREAEASQDSIVVGTDPRLGEMAHQFLSARRRLPQRSELFETPIARVRELVQSERREDFPTLISCLEGLRGLVEQNSHADVVGILGDL